MNAVTIDDHGQVRGVEINAPYEVHAMDDAYSYDKTNSNPLDDGLSVAVPLTQAANMASSSSSSRTTPTPATSIQSFLQTVPHLFSLTAEQIASLKVMVREYGAMNVIIEEGAMIEHVYVLASGTIEVMNSKRGLKRAYGHRRIGSITAPNIFGLDDAILDKPVEFTYHASTAATLLLIAKREFVALFAQSPILASNVSSHIVQTLPAFAHFQDYCRAIFGLSGAAAALDCLGDRHDSAHRIALASFVNLYAASGTVLHRYCRHPAILDGEALQYCVRRLPANVTETHVLLLTHALPEYLANAFVAEAATLARCAPCGRRVAASATPVDTGKRRRCAWRIGGGGQTVVVMRDGFTDPVDFMSNLAMFIVEARKMCARMRQLVAPSALEVLCAALVARDAREADGATSAGNNNNDNTDDDGDDDAAVFAQLRFTAHEAAALRATWGRDAVRQLYNLLVQRGEFVVQLHASSARRFAPDAYAMWSITLLRHIKACVGLRDADQLPRDAVVIDVLFSPNRTVKNLFCSMLDEFKDVIAAADGNTSSSNNSNSATTTTTTTWKNEEDRYYYIFTQLLDRDETTRAAYRARLERNGFALIEDAHTSALLVDVIDVGRVCVDDVDSALRAGVRAAQQQQQQHGGAPRQFIVNVDKTFGAQIEAVLRSLLLMFGNRVRSVNLMGKAAGLAGQRGDVALPSRLIFAKHAFGEDSADEVRRCNHNTLTRDDLLPFLGKSCSAQVRAGACVTLPGFIMQCEPVLKFYQIVHGCTAVEMQGSYMARQLEECRRAGVLGASVPSRYLFYYDDMPLGNADGTPIKSRKREIIATIYATARSLLCKMLAPPTQQPPRRRMRHRGVAHYDLTSRRIVDDADVLYQLVRFARQHALTTPLWLTARHAARLRLRVAYATAPLCVWRPLCGDCFVPLSRGGVPAYLPPPPPHLVSTTGDGDDVHVLARDADGVARWRVCPLYCREAFAAAGGSGSRSTARRAVQLWVSKSLLRQVGDAGGSGGDPRKRVMTPYAASCCFCVDQLTPCAALTRLIADARATTPPPRA